MEFGLDKCAKATFKRGKKVQAKAFNSMITKLSKARFGIIKDLQIPRNGRRGRDYHITR